MLYLLNLLPALVILGMCLLMYVAAFYTDIWLKREYGCLRRGNRLALYCVPALMEIAAVVLVVIGLVWAFRGERFEPFGPLHPLAALAGFTACFVAAFLFMGGIFKRSRQKSVRIGGWFGADGVDNDNDDEDDDFPDPDDDGKEKVKQVDVEITCDVGYVADALREVADAYKEGDEEKGRAIETAHYIATIETWDV